MIISDALRNFFEERKYLKENLEGAKKNLLDVLSAIQDALESDYIYLGEQQDQYGRPIKDIFYQGGEIWKQPWSGYFEIDDVEKERVVIDKPEKIRFLTDLLSSRIKTFVERNEKIKDRYGLLRALKEVIKEVQ